MSVRRIGFAVLLPLLGACYSYARIETAELHPGMSVRARVNGATAEQIEPILGISDARLLSGTLISSTPDTFIVEVPAVYMAEVGSSIQTLNQRVSIPRSGLLEIESRKLNRVKTYAIAGAAAVLVGGYILKSTVLDPGGERPPPGGGGPELRIPIFGFAR